ncbi:hypothetical protein AGRO_2647 [Agrobacterium sp. ATCC 31749]|uniref:hypothetical protein n=1 Tax=unclassified Agrobacterium TaxID=2632611 RepID=UPI00020DBCB9|nr:MULTISPECIES: hypothetical protein [unclassified Agrobacterium]EGL64438.1 hypothetical protein AGRO_2647 [Agrobacterium sp. ATCC 31749]QKW95814.1 hypothetical protein GSF67_01090 [Agrobacterium sp. CGMCC 11546]
MLEAFNRWLAVAGVALTFVVSAFLYGRSTGKADASAEQLKRNAKAAAKARGIEDDVRKTGDADVKQRLDRWMRD